MGRSRAVFVLGAIVAVLASGCQSERTPEPRSAASSAASHPMPAVVKPVAYVNSQPISRDDLWTTMIEADGGVVLEEIVLDRLLAERLQRAGITLNDGQIQAERDALLATLDSDPDRALRLLNELRLRRGLGDKRFAGLLRRNAGLRALTPSEVQVGDAAVRQAFEMEYGPRFLARIIVVESLQDAAGIAAKARGGESFIDLAIARSTDASRAQGGRLDPISPADATYPQVIRNVLEQLEVGDVSDPVSLERGYAVLKLEQKIPAQAVRLDDVKEALTLRVRRQMERIAMQQLARTILSEADVVVFDATLQKQWSRRKEEIDR